MFRNLGCEEKLEDVGRNFSYLQSDLICGGLVTSDNRLMVWTSTFL